ncbi:unnamed protein product [Bursaphelenchus okinawaensis]|uniref:Uncharacterized protein n=1 Tax=Bursaphelenchus okinawaensis TaxID=465554 RepID=A0A811L5T1_9BILA|nr:unnamed protein product [Bursaphelenchus okinawaensis]CAG9117980.1 unnamed protein product [Bursaphelenchus okinawaensis]
MSEGDSNSTFTLESLKQLRIGKTVLLAITDVNTETRNIVNLLDLIIDIVICVVYGLAVLCCLLILILFVIYQRQRRKDKYSEWLEKEQDLEHKLDIA